MPRAKIQRKEIHNLQYAYTLTEDHAAEKPLLVFLHEGLGSIELWKDFPSKVGASLDLDILVFDRNGYGHSDPLVEKRGADYLHRAALQELPAILQQIVPERKYIFWGHSDGGTIALLQANGNSNCVGVITEAAHVIVEKETLEGILPAIDAFEKGKLKGLSRYHGDKTETIFYAWAHTWLAPSFKDWNICSEITDVRCPVLAMQGEDDQYGTYRQLELIRKNVHGYCQVEAIGSCGHAPHVEQQEKALQTGVKFIKEYVINNN